MSPYLRMSQPIPPPSVSPAMPVWVTMPEGTARPKTWVSRSSSPRSTPAWARAVPASGSTRMPFMGERSMTTPPSQEDRPGKLWPPPRTAVSRPERRPNATAAMTSATPVHWATRAGERSMDPFQIARASS